MRRRFIVCGSILALAGFQRERLLLAGLTLPRLYALLTEALLPRSVSLIDFYSSNSRLIEEREREREVFRFDPLSAVIDLLALPLNGEKRTINIWPPNAFSSL